MAKSAMEMVVELALKNLPADVREQIDVMGKSVANYIIQQNRIEAKLDRLLALHGLTEPANPTGKVIDHAENQPPRQ